MYMKTGPATALLNINNKSPGCCYKSNTIEALQYMKFKQHRKIKIKIKQQLIIVKKKKRKNNNATFALWRGRRPLFINNVMA